MNKDRAARNISCPECESSELWAKAKMRGARTFLQADDGEWEPVHHEMTWMSETVYMQCSGCGHSWKRRDRSSLGFELGSETRLQS